MEMQAKDEQVQVFKELASASCVHMLCLYMYMYVNSWQLRQGEWNVHVHDEKA